MTDIPPAASPAPGSPSAPVILEAGGALVAISDAAHGRIVRLRLAGRDWLAGDGIAEWLAAGGADTGEAGGAATERLPGAAAARTRWTGSPQPFAFERTVTVAPDGAVRAEYVLTSHATEPTAFLWQARTALGCPPNTRLDLPVAARVRVWDARGVQLGGRGARHRWPAVRVGGPDATRFGPREVDLTFPALAARRMGEGAASYAAALVLDLPQPAGGGVRLGVEQDGARLELATDPAAVAHAALWLDVEPARASLTLAPAIGAGLALPGAAAGDAGAGWEPATLAPGETRRWAVTWRGRAAPVGV